jgi:biotin carboxylase
MARVLLLVPAATYRVADFLEAAARLGVEVVVGGDQENALQELMGARSLQLPLDDPEAACQAIVAHDAVFPLDAVVAVDDRGTLVASLAASRLGLRTNPPDAVAAARDKLLMRVRLGTAEVPQPAFAPVMAHDGPAEIARLVEAVGLPCVVKPTTLSGSRGVIRVDSAEEAVVVVDRVRAIATDAGASGTPLLVERFVPGPEVAVEGLLGDGELRVLAVFDKPDPLEGPYFEETIYVTPSRLGRADVDAAAGAAAGACRAIGLTHGPVHAEVRVRDGRASVIEVAARTIGGLCARTLTFAAGASLEQLVLAQAVGRPVGITTPRDRASGVLMLPIARGGTLEKVSGRDEALAVPGITELDITIPVGRPVVPLPEGDRYLGFLFARGSDPAAVESALRRAHSLLDVHIV